MARPSKHDGSIYTRKDGKVLWMVYRDRGGKRIRESTFTEDWQEAQKKLRERLQSRDDRILDVVRKGEQLQFSDWADFFLENYSKPPIRAEKTHEANERGCLHLKQAFGKRAVGDITVDDIELYLRKRLQTRVQVRTAGGVVEKDRLKPATVHQELRILRRMMNVAVRKKLLPANPCAGVEFPVKVKGLFRPHYMAWSEQQRIEFQAPEYLRNIIRIISETGLRVYKELMPMKKEQVDLQNALVWIPDSKTPNGIAEVPLTSLSSRTMAARRGASRNWRWTAQPPSSLMGPAMTYLPPCPTTAERCSASRFSSAMRASSRSAVIAARASPSPAA